MSRKTLKHKNSGRHIIDLTESRYRQMSKPRFANLKQYLRDASFLDADAEGDYDDGYNITSEASEQAEEDIQDYFDNTFGRNKIHVHVNVSETMYHPQDSYNKAARGASYYFDGNHNITLTIAQLGVTEQKDLEKYENHMFTLRDLGRAEQKIYEVLIHELLHMQQFLKYSQGRPSVDNWKSFIKEYEELGGASGMGKEYFFYDGDSSELETFSLQIAVELVDSLGKEKAIELLVKRPPPLSTFLRNSSSFRTMKREKVDLTRNELLVLLKRAKQYAKRMN